MSHQHDDTCLEIAERLSEYLDGELPADLRALVEAHNERCAACETFVESLRRTKQLGYLLPPHPLSPRELERLADEARKSLDT